jgi:hypothetical protein
MHQRFDVVPGQFLTRWHYRKFSRLYDARDRPVIDLQWEDFPRGPGRIVGQVHDQNGRPLTEYFVTLTRQIGERMDWSDAETIACKKAVLDGEGLFDLRGLPPGEYTAMIRHFDYETHVSSFDGPKVVVPETANALVEAEWEVEAKDRFYGRIQAENGRPLPSCLWSARDFGNRVHEDGTFRVCLSQAEQDDLKILAGNMIDIHGVDGGRLLQIPLTALSRDPAKPAAFVVK